MTRRRRKTVITNSKEIYKKLNDLNFTSHIVLEDVKNIQIQRIVNNINKKNKILDMDVKDGFVIIKKLRPLNFNIYLRRF